MFHNRLYYQILLFGIKFWFQQDVVFQSFFHYIFLNCQEYLISQVLPMYHVKKFIGLGSIYTFVYNPYENLGQ